MDIVKRAKEYPLNLVELYPDEDLQYYRNLLDDNRGRLFRENCSARLETSIREKLDHGRADAVIRNGGTEEGMLPVSYF
jgi:hypothetical protein